jgi:hypothetical protein
VSPELSSPGTRKHRKHLYNKLRPIKVGSLVNRQLLKRTLILFIYGNGENLIRPESDTTNQDNVLKGGITVVERKHHNSPYLRTCFCDFTTTNPLGALVRTRLKSVWVVNGGGVKRPHPGRRVRAYGNALYSFQRG